MSFFENTTLDEERKSKLEEYVDFKNIHWVKTECYYCTKHGKVKGIMSVKDEIIMYDPIICKENENFKKWDINQKFQSCIDLKDV